MKKTLVAFVVLAVGLSFAQTTCFDFDAAAYLGDQIVIENYMEGVSGWDIGVSGGLIGNGIIPGPAGGSLGDHSNDHYVQSSVNICGSDTFSFTFDRDICEVSFQWGTRNNWFHAEGDGVEFFSGGGSGLGRWYTGTTRYAFATPVRTLTFHNSGLGEIEVDDLCVATDCSSVVPAPGAYVLGCIGVSVIGLLKRRKIV
jgi:hypothetical protein